MRVPPVILWRIAKHTPMYSADDLSGGGAKMTGGRWNSKDQAVVYTSESIALATLETLAHLGDRVAIRNAFLVRVEVPAAVWAERETVPVTALDPTWVAEPAGLTTIKFGDAWLQSLRSPLIEVPSVIVPEEKNILINPAHTMSRKIRASVSRQYMYDPRL